MYCPKCGNPINDSANFCGSCGYRTATPMPKAPAPVSPTSAPARSAIAKKKLPLSTIITGAVALLAILALAAVLVLRGGSSADAVSAGTTPGFATPEDAIKHFSQALAANDFDKAMQACAIYEQAAGFDFAGFVDRMQTAMLYTQLAPANSDVFVDMNCAAVKGRMAVQVKMMIYSLFVDEGLDGAPIIPADRAYAQSIMQAIDPQQLGNLKLLRIDPPMKDALESEVNVKNFTTAAKISGADEKTERIALYEFNGQAYMGGFTLLHYEDGWKIGDFVSNLAGTSVMGTLEKVSLEDYAALL